MSVSVFQTKLHYSEFVATEYSLNFCIHRT